MTTVSLNPAKYDGKPVTDLRKTLLRRDAAEIKSQQTNKIQSGRVRRIATAGVASVALGVLTQKFPGLKSIAGPFGIDHVVAISGAIAAIALTNEDADEEDFDLADYSEGVAMAGMVPLLREMSSKGMAIAESIV